MMTNNENLFIVAAEECAEIQQAISKAIRFGLSNHHPQSPNLTNVTAIVNEYYQLQAVFEMMFSRGLLPKLNDDCITAIKQAKEANVIYYTELSKSLDRIQETQDFGE